MTELEKKERLVSLDAYRGFVMLAMVSEGMGFSRVARQFPDSDLWHFLAYQLSHVDWVGCAFWDLIQPSFMFMVGVSMPYSYGQRKARGDSYRRRLGHALYRAFILTALGVFLYSNGRARTNFIFPNVLAQIGLGYAFVFLFLDRKRWVQLLGVSAILIGYWLLFFLYPLPPESFNFAEVGVTPGEQLPGLFGHWSKNTNAAARFDAWFLNLFPRDEPFLYNGGGYQTLNFIPSMATMIFGLMAGEMLRTGRDAYQKLVLLLLSGALLFCLGITAGVTVCPIVKRIWSPSWALFSSGWTFLFLAGFYWFVDLQGYKRVVFPLVIVGMNSIAIYIMDGLMRGWIAQTFQTHLGQGIFDGPYGPIVEHTAILLFAWLTALWLYRQRIFIRI